ncbi:MAG: hypothetical protein IKD52_07490, partial [Exiguobacterium sp.]|nr:hypothetical protein [Exiguobacterium sp.]MBR2680358.1 hypothetical protein [Exiguobacterium sp.]MBR2757908.1 hypothetical protein [Exiguobacterium sp.]
EARFEESNIRIADARARKEAANQEFEVAREQADVEAMKNAKADLVALAELEQHFVQQHDALIDQLNNGNDAMSIHFAKVKSVSNREWEAFQREKYEAEAATHIQALSDLFEQNIADLEEYRAAIREQANRLKPYVSNQETYTNMANGGQTKTILGESLVVRQAYDQKKSATERLAKGLI